MEIGPPADIYGLGATLFHMVTGRVPFEGKNPSVVMHRHLKTPLEPPDHLNPELSAGAAQIIEMMMAKKVQDRYQNAADLIEDIGLVLKGQPPHFAHRTLDQVAITEIMTDVAEASPSEIPQRDDLAPKQSNESRTLFFILIVMALSILCNLILLTVVILK